MAPKRGNTNALKHGLYAQRFTPDDKKHLAAMPANSIVQEIALMRKIIDRATATLATAETALDDLKTVDKDGNPIFDNDGLASYSKLLNSFSTAVTTLNTLVRTHGLLTGEYDPLGAALDEALLDFDPYYKDDQEPEWIHVNKAE